MLTNPLYAGHAIYNGQQIGQAGTWRPLVTPETFAVVQHRLGDPRRAMNRLGTDRRHLGSGLYLCSCGLRVRGWSGNRYRCADGCYSRSGTEIDPFVEAVVAERLARPDLADLLTDTGSTARAGELLAESRRLRERLTTVEADYDAGLIDGRRYATATEKIGAQLQAVETQRARLLAGAGPAGILTAPSPADAYRSSSLMIRRTTVEYLAEVTLHPAPRGSRTFDPSSVQIEWKGQA